MTGSEEFKNHGEDDIFDDDVYGDEGSADEMEDDDDDILNENSYTSDILDDNPQGSFCDMPDDEAVQYHKKK